MENAMLQAANNSLMDNMEALQRCCKKAEVLGNMKGASYNFIGNDLASELSVKAEMVSSSWVHMATWHTCYIAER